MHISASATVWVTALLALPILSAAQSPEPPAGTLTDRVEAAESDGYAPRRQLVEWNEFEGPYMTVRLGGAFLYDYAAYNQNEASKTQLSLDPRIACATHRSSSAVPFQRLLA